MNKERFSYFLPPWTNTSPSGILSLEEVWEYISGRKTLQIYRNNSQTGVPGKESLQEVTRIVRNLPPEVYKSKTEGKGTYLPMVTFGGVFSKREGNGLREASGFVNLDIDDISDLPGVSLDELKERLSQDREIGLRLLFTSPSGNGLKIVCKTSGEITDRDSYRREFEILNSFVSRKYSIPRGSIGLDKGISDITRGCLLCFDPGAVLKTWPDTFDPVLHSLPEKEIRRPRKERRTPDSVSSWDGDTFKEERLIPALFERIDSVFPEMSFQWRGNRWESPLKLDGSPAKVPRKDKTVVTQEVPGVILEQGGERVQVIDYYMRRNSLRFPEAVKELSRLVGLEEEELELRRRYAQMREKETDMERYTTGGERPLQTGQDARKDPLQTPIEADLGKYRQYLEIPDIQKEVSKKRGGIITGYTFRNSQGKRERFTLSPGLTLICGKSSHGKSRFLQNLSLQILEDLRVKGEEGEVLFFAFEEDYPEVLLQFANLYINTPGLSQYGTKNTEVLRDYFQTGDLNKSPDSIRREILPRLERFKEIQTSGKLRIYYSPDLRIKGDRERTDGADPDLRIKGDRGRTDGADPDLSGVISFLSSQRPIKAVFLDYVQAIYKEGYRKDRREELREICKELNALSKRLDIPFVLSAQLNRETPNPTSMSGDNIAESADITRYSDTILCLWNSAFLRDVKNKETYLDSLEYKEIQGRGFSLGVEGSLYCYLAKNRGGTPYVDAVLDYVGETGEIPTNENRFPEPPPNQMTIEYD